MHINAVPNTKARWEHFVLTVILPFPSFDPIGIIDADFLLIPFNPSLLTVCLELLVCCKGHGMVRN